MKFLLRRLIRKLQQAELLDLFLFVCAMALQEESTLTRRDLELLQWCTVEQK